MIPAHEIAAAFETQSGHEVSLVGGSSGKHYAQIINGAPFDLFFAADSERPARLEAEGHAVAGSRYTYALGQLVLWSSTAGLVDRQGKILTSGGFAKLAIANPDLAPYGRASRQALESMGLWESLKPRLVRGENIAQAYQFAHSGNAEIGLVAGAQVFGHSEGSRWPVPARLHEPIRQQAVLLTDGDASSAFYNFARSAPALEIIAAHGYDVSHVQ